ncbi:uncharacterized protein LOC134846812 isoform X2 [Symsagittifera roscoffensis]|uniref:uncharacterized protein LOC134846812 isoform X2 n=1 Tax=Symsagittifera roscoffensis TaxID=84072 RepID=UPI00307C92F3
MMASDVDQNESRQGNVDSQSEHEKLNDVAAPIASLPVSSQSGRSISFLLPATHLNQGEIPSAAHPSFQRMSQMVILNDVESYTKLGNTELEKGHVESALNAFSTAFQRSAMLDDKRILKICCLNLGALYISLQKPQKGLSYLLQASTMGASSDLEFDLNFNFGLAYEALGHAHAAIHHFKIAAKFLEQQGLKETEQHAEICLKLSNIFKILSSTDTAIKYCKKSVVAYEKLQNLEKLLLSHFSLADYLIEKQDLNEALMSLDSCYQILTNQTPKSITPRVSECEQQTLELLHRAYLMKGDNDGKAASALTSCLVVAVKRSSQHRHQNTQISDPADGANLNELVEQLKREVVRMGAISEGGSVNQMVKEWTEKEGEDEGTASTSLIDDTTTTPLSPVLTHSSNVDEKSKEQKGSNHRMRGQQTSGSTDQKQRRSNVRQQTSKGNEEKKSLANIASEDNSSSDPLDDVNRRRRVSDNASYIAKGLAVEIHDPAETSGSGLKLSKKKTDHDRTLTDSSEEVSSTPTPKNDTLWGTELYRKLEQRLQNMQRSSDNSSDSSSESGYKGKSTQYGSNEVTKSPAKLQNSSKLSRRKTRTLTDTKFANDSIVYEHTAQLDSRGKTSSRAGSADRNNFKIRSIEPGGTSSFMSLSRSLKSTRPKLPLLATVGEHENTVEPVVKLGRDTVEVEDTRRGQGSSRCRPFGGDESLVEHSSTDMSLMQGTSRMMESTLDANSKSIRSKRSILPQFKGSVKVQRTQSNSSPSSDPKINKPSRTPNRASAACSLM